MSVVVLSLEEFTAKRKPAQTRVEDALRPLVERALDSGTDTGGWNEVLAEVAHQWRMAYAEESGTEIGMPNRFRDEITGTLRLTDRASADDNTVERIVVWLATAILSHATATAARDDEEELFVEWVSMGDESVRPAHRRVAGQVRPVGEPFSVSGFKMRYPGDPSVPIELWINCRCTLRPVLASEALAASFRDVSPEERKRDAKEGRAMPDGSYPIDNCEDLRNAIRAIGRAKDPEAVRRHIKKRKSALDCPDVELPEDWALTAAAPTDVSLCIVAVPADDDPVRPIGPEEKHATLLFLHDVTDEAALAEAHAAVEGLSGAVAPFDAAVLDTTALGSDDPQAKVALVDGEALSAVRDMLLDNETLRGLFEGTEQYPEFTPHVTLGYGDEVTTDDLDSVRGLNIHFDRLAVWHGEDRTEYALGGGMDPEKEMPEEMPDDMEVPPGEAQAPAEDIRVPWYGVIAPEGVRSGDGRRFKQGALRARPLPLPLTWQKQSSGGHDGNVTVAKMERLARKPIDETKNEIRSHGYFLLNAEADEVIGLIGEFGKFGVSVDADDASFEFSEDEEVVDFSDARACSACIVSIPAFSEAWVALGEPPEDWYEGAEDLAMREDDAPLDAEDEALVAAATFVDIAPGVTEDGPGWLTHPVDTDRLRDYWVRGEGAAKIAWGAPGDFNRCRLNLAKYVKPQYLSGYCANRHKDALGFWPGEHHAAVTAGLEHTDPAPALSLVASDVPDKAPSAWFVDPGLEGPTPLTITEDGRVFGHIAEWGVCHMGYEGQCVVAPHSTTDYAYFLLGEVLTDVGPVAVGNLTIGAGHAPHGLRARGAMAHYDNSCAVFADVNVGEDEHGIWCAGWVRPGTPTEMVHAARASKLSGDWRMVDGEMEMIAALAVNVPGFRILRPSASVKDGQQVSLVAAGMVAGTEEQQNLTEKIDLSVLADAVAEAIVLRQVNREKMAALASDMNGAE